MIIHYFSQSKGLSGIKYYKLMGQKKKKKSLLKVIKHKDIVFYLQGL